MKNPAAKSVLSLTDNYANRVGWQNTMTQLSVKLNWVLYYNRHTSADFNNLDHRFAFGLC